MQSLKSKVVEVCLAQLNERKARLIHELEQLKLSAEQDTKSSMGDKYETGREMINLEKGKISEQLTQVNQMLDMIRSVDPNKRLTRPGLGALIKTEMAHYFIAVGLGQISVNDQAVFVISMASPIGRIILDKSVGDTFEMAGKTLRLLEID
jgi:transcription elongation GreA/GreB family factor